MTLTGPSLAREFEAAAAWWRAAGVDCAFTDDATAWLADAPFDGDLPQDGASATMRRTSPLRQPADQPAQSRKAHTGQPDLPAPVTIRRDLLGDSPPPDLAAFRQWWMAAPGIDSARLNPRIPPRGSAGAALMVLVPQPEENDRDQLMEGPQGRLLANILAAMGIDDSTVYLASALPCYTPMADLAALSAGGMDAVLAHHIRLAAPQRLVVLGTSLDAMLGSAGRDHTDQPLREINHSAGKIPVMVSETLDSLVNMPRLKARFWRRWMEWSAPQ